MGVIKRADIEEYTRQAYVMDMDDLEKRGRSVVDAANAEAQQILRVANAKRNQLLATAEKDGYDKGQRDGYEQGYIDGVVNGVEDARKEHHQVLDQLTEIWTIQLDAFEKHRNTMIEQARLQIVELAGMIAQRVTRRVIELDPSVVLNQIEAALSSVTESTRLVLAVHPGDVELSQTELPQILEKFAVCEHAQIVTDPSLERGSCVARTSTGGVIDASIAQQLDRVIQAILPEQGSDAGRDLGGLSTQRYTKQGDPAGQAAPSEHAGTADARDDAHTGAGDMTGDAAAGDGVGDDQTGDDEVPKGDAA